MSSVPAPTDPLSTPLPRGRDVTRAVAVATVLLLGLLLALAGTARADAPNFLSNSGVTVKGVQTINDRLLDVTVTSAAVTGGPREIHWQGGNRHIRILLPTGYAQHPGVRYPVLYLLHGAGDGANAGSWTVGGGDAQNITADKPIITVMPDAGPAGWYSDWVNQNWAGPQRWETFHMRQMIPWVDANLRTIAAKQGRAIAGLSMGGFGAIQYAARYPQLFNHTASFSGALDLNDLAQRSVITGSEQMFYGGTGLIFGNGLPFFFLDIGWINANPLTHFQGLRQVPSIALYTGNKPGDVFEDGVNPTNHRFDDALRRAGIPHSFWDYGLSNGPGCDGGHNFGCWNNDLRDDMPRMLSALQHP